MRWTTPLLILTTLGALAAPGGAQADADVETLREHALVTLDGEEFRIADFEGKVVVVNFWASWCKPCRKELPELDEWKQEMKDVEFVTISIDEDLHKAERLVEREGLSLAVCHDGPNGLARAMDLDFLPSTYVLGPDGKVALITPGVTPERMAHMKSEIERLRGVAGEVAPAQLGRDE